MATAYAICVRSDALMPLSVKIINIQDLNTPLRLCSTGQRENVYSGARGDCQPARRSVVRVP